MIKIWGRADGSNVIKAMWCIGELGLEFERIDWGGSFGGNDDPEYRAMNPMGRLPTLVEEDGFTLWESGAVVRYLCAKHDTGGMCPDTLRGRAEAEKWMDWSSLNLAPFNSIFLDQFFKRPAAEQEPDVIAAATEQASKMYAILDRQLAGRAYLCGDNLTMADIPSGVLTHRWMTWTPSRPSYPNVEAWYGRLAARPAYQEHVIAQTRTK